jgi:hypothetical protein
LHVRLLFHLREAVLPETERKNDLPLTLSRALPDFTEILPEGEKEKQPMQGPLNQRDKLEQKHGMLF